MAKITLELNVDAEKGTATLKQFAGDAEAATKKAGDAAKEGGKGFGQFASSLDETVEKLKGLLTPVNLLGAGIGYGLVEALRHAQEATIEYASELTRLKGVTGASIEELGGLREAADKMGVGSNQLQRALLLMSSQIEAGGEALGRMGISVEDVNGKQKAELTLLFEVIDKLSGMTNKTKAAALAKDTFGRAVGELLPLLLSGSERIKELGQSGADFAKEVGDEALVQIREFRGELTETGDAVTRLQITVMRDAIPVLSVLAQTFVVVVDTARQIPAPLRYMLEIITLLIAGLVSLSLVVKTVGIAWGILTALPGVAWLGSIATAVGSVVAAMNPWILILTGLGGLLYMAFTGQLDSITERYTSFLSNLGTKTKGFAGGLWESFKMRGMTAPEAPGLSAADDARELRTAQTRQQLAAESSAELERNLALRQKRLEIDKEILAETLKYYQATQAPEQAQINTIKDNLAFKLRELEIKKELRKDLAGQYDKEEAEAKRAASAQIVAIEMTALKTIDAARAESLKAKITASETGEAKIRDLAKAETDAIEQQLTDQRNARTLSQAEIVQAEEKTKQITIKMNEDLRNLALQQATQLSAIAQKEADVTLKAREDAIEHNIAGLEREQVARQHALDTFTISLEQFTAESITNTEAVTQAKLDSLNAQEQAAGETATRELALAELRWTGIIGGEVELANKTLEIQADLQKKLQDIAGQRVKVEDEKTKQILALRLQEAKQAGILFAQEAGYIEDLKRKRDQSLQNIGTVLEQQARQAGDLGAAYQVGFTHAASSADDAFSVMRKAGADAYQSLKSGLSDFLFDVFTRAKNIGDVFVNLGKRILRTMTDAFAEIAVKWAMTAAGFTLPSLLSTGTAAAASQVTQWQEATEPISNVLKLGNAASTASAALSGTANSSALVTVAFSAITQTIGMFASGIVAVLQFIGSIASGNAAGGIVSIFGSGSGSFLGQLFSGLSSVFTALSGGFNEIFQSTIDLLTNSGQNVLGFGGLDEAMALGKGLSFIADAAPWIGAAYGLYQMFSGQLSPLSGALQGTMIGAMFGGPIGAGIGAIAGTIAGVLSKIFGGLFSGPTPEISGQIQLSATDIQTLLAAQSAVHYGEQGPTVVNPPGRSQFSYLDTGPLHQEMYYHRTHGTLSREESQIEIQNVVLATLQAAVKGLSQLSAKLPTEALSQALSARIDAVLAQGFDITSYDFEGDVEDVVSNFRDFVQSLSSQTLTVFMTEMFPSIDLAALGAGDAAKGFDVLASALAGFSNLLVQSGYATAFADDSIEQFASRSVEFFQKLQNEGESLTDTITRVTQAIEQAISQLNQFRVSTTQWMIELQTSLSTFTLQSGGGLGEVSFLSDLLPTLFQGLSQNLRLQFIVPLVTSFREQLLSGIDAGFSTSDFDGLRQQIIGFGVDAFRSLQQEANPVTAIQGLQILTQSSQNMLAAELEGAKAYYAQQIALAQSAANARIAQLEEERQAISLDTSAIEAQITAAEAHISQLEEEKRGIQESTKGLEDQIQAIKDLGQARLEPLQEEQRLLQDQLSTLQQQAQAIQAWKGVLDSVTKQLTDMQLSSANPQNVLERLNIAQQLVAQAKAKFAAEGTSESATALQGALTDELKIAQEAYQRPSSAYQQIFEQVSTDLQQIQSVADSHAADLEHLTQEIATRQARIETLNQQMKEIEQQTRDSVRPLQTQLDALKAVNAARLQEIAIEEAQIQASVQPLREQLEAMKAEAATRLQAIQTEEAQVRATLQTTIADLMSQQDATIQSFREEATGWLRAIRNEALTRLEQAIREGDAEIARLLGLNAPDVGGPLMMTLARISQAYDSPNLAQDWALASQSFLANDIPNVIHNLQSYLQHAIAIPWFESDPGQQIIQQIHGMIGSFQANDLWAAIESLRTILQIAHDAGLTEETPVPGFQHGLAFVPRDDFLARLHHGERILTADENRTYSNGQGGNVTIHFAPTVQVEMTGSESPDVIRRKIDEATATLLVTPSRTRAALVRFAREQRG